MLDRGLIFERCAYAMVHGFVDFDYVGDLDKRRSTTEYCFMLTGGSINRKSQLRSIIALSTIEAECIDTVKEVIWLHGLVSDLGVAQAAVIVFYDSQSVIHLVKNHVHSTKTKHIDVLCHHLRDVEHGVVTLVKVDTGDNHADMLTKVISRIKFEHYIGVRGHVG